MTQPMPLTQSLAQIQDWMVKNAPGVTFRPPANLAAVENFAVKSRVDIPEALRQTLMVADGESRKSAGAIGNWRLMPIAEIQAAWGLLNRLKQKGAFAGLTPNHSPYLVNKWWHESWIPIVSSDNGDYFCLDTQPPETDRSGQVLLFLQTQPHRPLVAGSLAAWFDRIVRDLADGVYAYDPIEGFDGEAFMWSALESKHLFDHLGGRLVAG